MRYRLARFCADSEERLDLLTRVDQQVIELKLSPEQVLSVIEADKAVDRSAVSRVEAQGLMPVTPFWRDKVQRSGDNLTDSPTNLYYGCHILRFHLDR